MENQIEWGNTQSLRENYRDWVQAMVAYKTSKTHTKKKLIDIRNPTILRIYIFFYVPTFDMLTVLLTCEYESVFVLGMIFVNGDYMTKGN